MKMKPIDASKKLNEKIVYCNLQDKRYEIEPKFKLIKNEFLVKQIAQIGLIFYIQSPKTYTIQFLHIELTKYLRDTIKTY